MSTRNSMAIKRPASRNLSDSPKAEVVVVNYGNGIEMVEAGNVYNNDEVPAYEMNQSYAGEIPSTSHEFSVSQYIDDIMNPQNALYPVLQPATKKRRQEYDNLRQLLEEGKLELQPMKKSETFVKWVVDGSSKLAVYCEVCKSFLSKNSGGSLTEHVRACKTVLNPELLPSTSVTPEQKKYFLEKTVDAIAKNLLPKNHVISDGFVSCIQAAINIGFNSKKAGSTTGPPSANELVPNEKAVDHFLTTKVEKHGETLYAMIREIVKANGGIVSIDMRSLKDQFIGYIIHCFDHSWNLQAYPIDLYNGSDFMGPVKRIVNRFDLSPNNTLIVNDQESKAIKYHRVPCTATVLENICEYALTPKALKLDLAPDVVKAVSTYSKLMKDLEDVVGAIRNSPTLNEKLDASFDYEVKWMPQVIMVKTFLLSSSSDFETMEQYFKTNNPEVSPKFSRLKSGRNSMKEYADIFKPFPEAVKKLENAFHPTLQFVYPTLDMLEKHLQVHSNPPNSPKAKLAISALNTMMHLKKQFLTAEHSFALCLDPLNKAELYKILGAPAFNDVKQLFEKEIHKMDEIPVKEENSEFNPFTSFNSLPAEIETELNLYYREKADPKNYNIISWWANNAPRFPLLAHFAKKILSIPATCASIDQLFGSLNTVNPIERSHMNAETLNNLVLYRSIVLANLQ